MSLTTLPHEIIVNILVLIDPLGIRRCEQTCRILHDLIRNDMQIQYILELDICGYAVPRVPRHDLTYTEKVGALRKRREAWQQTTLTEPLFVPLVPGPIHMDQLVNGLFACSYEKEGPLINLTPSSTRLIRFDQLPSTNQKTGHKSWTHELDFDVISFCMDPEQDLLVLLQQFEYAHDEEVGVLHESYKVHIRTISTCGAHPMTASSNNIVLELEDAVDWPEEFGFRCEFHIQICQNLVAVKLGAVTSELTPYLIIWDWMSGQQLACIATPMDDDEEPMFGFISKDYVVVPCPADRSEGEDAGIGCLDIYRIPHSQGAAQTQAGDRVAYLELPRVDGCAIVEIHCAPIHTSTTSACSTPAKTFEPSTGGYMRLDLITFQRVGRRPGVHFYGSLIVSSTILLDVVNRLLATGSGPGSKIGLPRRIPWQLWYHSTSYVDRGFAFRSPGWTPICISSQGLGFLEHSSVRSNFPSSVIVLDYNERRLRARKAGRCEFAGEIYSNYSKPSDEDPCEMGISWFLEGAFVGTKPTMIGYAQRSFKIPEPVVADYYDVMLDEEHVVIAAGMSIRDGDANIQRGLYVYMI